MADSTRGTGRLVAASGPRLTAAPERSRSTAIGAVAIVLVVMAWALLLRLGSLERGGPAHEDLSLPHGLPATLYLPAEQDDGELPAAPAKGEPRPPLVVVAHGYSADRSSMSGIARSLARAGYAVLSIDFRGHGANTNRFQGDLTDDLDAAVTWAKTSPYVDADRIAVLGHSMGAGAALELATQDDRIQAVIPLSGGWVVHDAVVPGHVLLLDAKGDPGRIRDRQDELADQLTKAGSEVRHREIDGTNHLTILRSSKAVREIIAFLDPVLRVDRSGPVPGIDDPRYRSALLYLIVVIGLLGLLGSLAGRIVAADEDGGASRGAMDTGTAPAWSPFVLVGGALLLTLPLLAAAPIAPLPLGAGQPIVIHLALASGVLWGLRALARSGQLDATVTTWIGDRAWLPSRSVAAVGLAAGAAIFALVVPLGTVFHRMVPTPQRWIYWVVMSALVFPFFAAFEALLRRGAARPAAGWAVLGRVLLLAVLLIGLRAGALPRVIALVTPLFVLQYAMLEVFAIACYTRARNAAVVAVVDAFVVGWLVTTLTPVG
jgi:dienelactone hydrolase